MVYGALPPTENKIRQQRWQGGTKYTAEAEGYRQVFREDIGKRYFMEIQQFLRGHKQETVYQVSFSLFFKKWDLLNKGWFQKKRSAKSPYKKNDVGNRRKLLEDCVAAALGVDDTTSFSLIMHKYIDDASPRVEIVIEEADPEEYGIPLEGL